MIGRAALALLGALCAALPANAQTLEEVVAGVEATYARRDLPDERLRALGAAGRRLRLRLLGLLFRRRRPRTTRR